MTKVFALLFSLMLCSCNFSNEEVYMKPVENNWGKKQVLQFDFDIKDAEKLKNIIFVVRNNNDYPYSNIRVISALNNFKEKKAKPDTLNYILAKPNGEWIGSGFGETKETLFQYRLNYKFPKNGKYTLTVQQAMRKDKLTGIDDFGVKIEQAQP